MEYPQITPEMMQEIEESTSDKWTAPDSARTSSNSGSQWWNERGTITGVEVKETQTQDGKTLSLYEITVGISPVGGSGLHGDKDLVVAFWINNEALKEGRTHEDHQRTSRNWNTLMQILRVAGIEADASGIFSQEEIMAAYPTEGNSNLINMEGVFEVNQYRRKNGRYSRSISNVFTVPADDTVVI